MGVPKCASYYIDTDQGPCQTYSEEHGCGGTTRRSVYEVKGGPGAASRDHEIYAVTWNFATRRRGLLRMVARFLT